MNNRLWGCRLHSDGYRPLRAGREEKSRSRAENRGCQQHLRPFVQLYSMCLVPLSIGVEV